MAEEYRQTSVLIVSSGSTAIDYFKGLLLPNRFNPIETAANAGEAERRVIEKAFGLVIINTPLPDDFGTKLAINLSRFETTGILLLVKSTLYEEILYKTENYGIVTLSKPVDKHTASQTINALVSMRNRMQSFESRVESLETRMEEIKIVNRAKLILVERLKMSEPEAHRFIEKSAMDRCVKKREIAENIIKTYEN
ncbi:MAG: ANTAR domain-containing protein [Clostridiales bacterium]|jgi:response regulator NasT|nr:ANTAR domain-containing protein [Clostridiales bacterium]